MAFKIEKTSAANKVCFKSLDDGFIPLLVRITYAFLFCFKGLLVVSPESGRIAPGQSILVASEFYYLKALYCAIWLLI